MGFIWDVPISLIPLVSVISFHDSSTNGSFGTSGTLKNIIGLRWVSGKNNNKAN